MKSVPSPPQTGRCCRPSPPAFLALLVPMALEIDWQGSRHVSRPTASHLPSPDFNLAYDSKSSPAHNQCCAHDAAISSQIIVQHYLYLSTNGLSSEDYPSGPKNLVVHPAARSPPSRCETGGSLTQGPTCSHICLCCQSRGYSKSMFARLSHKGYFP